MIAASEVATAICMRYSAGTSAKRSEYSSTGTVTIPPPTPSNPAAKPAISPETARMAISGSNSWNVTDAASTGGLAERPAGASGQRRMNFADDRQRDRLGSASADVEPHGRTQPGAQCG